MTLTGLYVPLITPFDARRRGRPRCTGGPGPPGTGRRGHRAGRARHHRRSRPRSRRSERRAVVDVAARVCRERRAPLLVGANTPDASRPGRAAGGDRRAQPGAAVHPSRRGRRARLFHPARLRAAPCRWSSTTSPPDRPALSADTLRRLAGVPGVAGLKYAVGRDRRRHRRAARRPAGGLAILGGDDVFISPLLALGAHGGILASAHVATADFAAAGRRLWRTGDATAVPGARWPARHPVGRAVRRAEPDRDQSRPARSGTHPDPGGPAAAAAGPARCRGHRPPPPRRARHRRGRPRLKIRRWRCWPRPAGPVR